ncbi:hypothetical protein [uncultured Neptuniibacter sp.]|uniref:hypothetical protein n=1 Tax=uncultured Neptuniibacter sp. TaxID=502143 RepID=UPI002622194B|nr:hypothetical protein [uncultured Neptuniibacter sp.]
MTIQDFRSIAQQLQINQVRFIESGCSPMVIEVQYGKVTDLKTDLLKDRRGEVLAFKNITQAYELCRDTGIHHAELVQIIPHDEACISSAVHYDQQAIPLKF